MTDAFKTPLQSICFEQEIKRSRFIARLGPASSREEALLFVQDSRQQYPSARHHCWAYLIGNPKTSTQLGFSDAGEPHGTAGKPMLNVLQHSDVGDLIAVITRYFGGIKLGTGGLSRAYSGTLQLALQQLPTTLKIPKVQIKITFPYPLESSVRYLLQQYEIQLTEADYQEHISFLLQVPSICKDEFFQQISLQEIKLFP